MLKEGLMNKRILGRTGFEVTEIGFGAWAIGSQGYGEVSDRQAQAVIEAYLEGGGNFIDTARRYGESERRLGDVLKRNGARGSNVGDGRIDAIQLIYSVFRQLNAESIAYALKNDVASWPGPCWRAASWRASTLPGARFDESDHRRRWLESHRNELLAEAEKLNSSAVRPPYSSLSEVAIRFALAQPGVSTVKAGAWRMVFELEQMYGIDFLASHLPCHVSLIRRRPTTATDTVSRIINTDECTYAYSLDACTDSCYYESPGEDR